MTTLSMTPPPDCIHCASPGTCSRLCDWCTCLACCDRRGEVCRTCVAWVSSLGGDARVAAHLLAQLRRTTAAQARADMLNDYHRQHMEDS